MRLGGQRRESIGVPLTAALEYSEQTWVGWRDIAASMAARTKIARILLMSGADANARSLTGETLICAARSGQLASVELLLSRHAQVDARTKAGTTALMWAAMNGHREVVRLLLRRRADVHAKRKNGRTALHYASKREHRKVVLILKSAGAT